MAALQHGSRKFYDIPIDQLSNISHHYEIKKKEKIKELLNYVEKNCIGNDVMFLGPYGHRKATYCDYTASGRSLAFIEDYIREQVLPHYGNTHTTTNVTSLQTTLYRHEARDVIRNAVNASECDSVVFVGSGATGAVHKLIHALDFKEPPVVFVGPFEHHSNLLPWKELQAELVWIEQDNNGVVDLLDLENKLKYHSTKGSQLIGCFSAASNVTGILTDVDAVTVCLHRHGALAFWDYATAGPYVEINMNPVVTNEHQGLVYKDAVFISTHKFVGGVGTPGVLVAKKKLFVNPVPSGCGGGSVFFVTHDTHRYLKEIEMREEAGTPAIVGSIRAGLVFQLKQEIGTTAIMAREDDFCRRVLEKWRSSANVVLLGNTSVPRLPIFSFLIRHPFSGVFLHHNYVCALLNDLFGIQARGGCACAGPYAQDLLGIKEKLAREIESLLLEDSRLDRVHLRRYHEYSEREILRPGFVRLNFPFFMSDDGADFVIKAVEMVAEHGWKLLPQYMFNPETGEWRHRRNQVFRDRKWLGSISYSEGRMTYPSCPLISGEHSPYTYEECLRNADEIFRRTSTSKSANIVGDQRLLLGQEGERLRWFLLPSEASDILSGKTLEHFPMTPPFVPPQWDEGKSAPQGTKIGGPDCGEPFQRCSGSTSAKCAAQKDPESLNSTQKLTGLGELNANALEKHGKKLSELIIDGERCEQRGQNGNGVKNSSSLLHTDVHCDGIVTFSFLNSSETENRKNLNTFTVLKKEAGLVLDERFFGDCNEEEKQKKRNDGKSSESPIQLAVSDKNGFDNGADCCDNYKTVQTEQLCCTANLNSSRDVSTIASGTQTTGMNGEIPTSARSESLGKTTRKKRQDEATAVGKPQFQHPPKRIFKPTVQALEEYEMIRDGDRVMVCLSGGKDSLSLLHALHQYQFYARSKGVNFTLAAATVDPQSSGYNPRPMIGYLAALDVPYFFEEQGIIQQAAQLPVCESICSFCSRMKRGRLYACARREGYNVLAMGQHLDDLTESFMMSVFHNGLLRTMKANYTVREGDLRVIRPFVYVREKDLRTFAEKVKLPVIAENCPACFEAPKERHRTKQLLAAQEILFPDLYHSLLKAMKPLMARDRVGLESSRMKAGDYDEFF